MSEFLMLLWLGDVVGGLGASATGTAMETETGKKLIAAFNKKVDNYMKGDEK